MNFVMQGSTKTWEKEEKAPPTRAWPAPVPHQIQRGHQELPTPGPTMSLEGRRSITTTRNWKGTGKFTIEKWSCEMCAHICLSRKIIYHDAHVVECFELQCCRMENENDVRNAWHLLSRFKFWSGRIIFTDICRYRWLSCPVFIRKGNLSICI